MRVCHPFPVALKAVTTSSDRRMLTAFFGVSNGGRPRFGRTATNSFGNTSIADLNSLRSSIVSSRTSPSRLVKCKWFAMSFCLSIICPSKTDYPDTARDWRKTDYMQSVIQTPDGDKSPIWAIVRIIFEKYGVSPFKPNDLVERQITLLYVFLRYTRSKFYFHTFIVYTKNTTVKELRIIIPTGGHHVYFLDIRQRLLPGF